MKEGATNMIEEIDKGMDQLKEQYIEPYVNQRKSSKGGIEDQTKADSVSKVIPLATVCR